MSHKIKEGIFVWVKDKAIAGSDFFAKGRVVSISGHKVTVETSSAVKTQELILPIAECYMMCPAEDVPDHCQLMYLSQPTLLENTKVRFMKDLIYTYVGDILVAVNPFKRIDTLYGSDVMDQCKGKKLFNAACGPHTYMISEKAYVTMKKKKHNQCIVVSGESGAGKTETNRHLLNYLVWRGTDAGSENTLTEKILDANPILEAFGNAKTTRNNNSSRFGRYAMVQFSDIYEVVGAKVRVFLLERSRVTSTANKGERSYHSFYQVVRSGKFVDDGHPEKYHYLNMSECYDVPGMDDGTGWQPVTYATSPPLPSSTLPYPTPSHPIPSHPIPSPSPHSSVIPQVRKQARDNVSSHKREHQRFLAIARHWISMAILDGAARTRRFDNSIDYDAQPMQQRHRNSPLFKIRIRSTGTYLFEHPLYTEIVQHVRLEEDAERTVVVASSSRWKTASLVGSVVQQLVSPIYPMLTTMAATLNGLATRDQIDESAQQVVASVVSSVDRAADSMHAARDCEAILRVRDGREDVSSLSQAQKGKFYRDGPDPQMSYGAIDRYPGLLKHPNPPVLEESAVACVLTTPANLQRDTVSIPLLSEQ